MSNEESKLHFMIAKQLKKNAFSEGDILPQKKAQWDEFLKRISNYLYDCEQERYLTERSMEISSQEMRDLNNKLELAQELAHMGYWTVDKNINKMSWSKEMFHLAGMDYSKGAPSLEDLKQYVHPGDREKFDASFEEAFSAGKAFEIELRFRNVKDGKYNWHFCKGQPQDNNTIDIDEKKTKQILTGIVIDITKRKQEELRKSLLHSVSSILVEHSSFNLAAPQLLKVICEALDIEVGELLIVDKNNKVLRHAFIWSKNNINNSAFVEASKTITFIQGIDLPGLAWANKEITWIENISKENSFTRLKEAKIANLHGAFALPIAYEGEVLAVIEFFSQSTFELDNDIINLLKDIDNKIGTYIEREQNQIQIATLSRLSGMSEIATSILHNIGNILNSASTSISLALEINRQPYIKKLVSICGIIKEHLTANDDYLTGDIKGKKIPDYLIALSKALDLDNEQTAKELANIDIHLNHIKDIVMLQKEFSGISGLRENLLLPQVIDLAIQMSNTLTTDITIEKTYKYHDFVNLDKSKLLQILVNLFSNARDSVILAKDNLNKIIKVFINPIGKKSVEIKISDNGLGIPKEKLTMIFSFGYTTKKNGHGFGLHSCALAAKEIGVV